MILATSTIITVLAVIGAISTGVWLTMAVQWFMNRRPRVPSTMEQSLIERLNDAQAHNKSLRAELLEVRAQSTAQQDLIMKKLLGS